MAGLRLSEAVVLGYRFHPKVTFLKKKKIPLGRQPRAIPAQNAAHVLRKHLTSLGGTNHHAGKIDRGPNIGGRKFSLKQIRHLADLQRPPKGEAGGQEGLTTAVIRGPRSIEMG